MTSLDLSRRFRETPGQIRSSRICSYLQKYLSRRLDWRLRRILFLILEGKAKNLESSINHRILGRKETYLLLIYLTKRAKFQSSKNPAINEANLVVKKPSVTENCSKFFNSCLVKRRTPPSLT